jgi:hypothetical protein
MNRLPLPIDTEMHSIDWQFYIKFWLVMFPGSRTAPATTKPRKVTK